MRPPLRSLLLPLALSLVVAAAFAPALSNDFVDWDDPLNLLENPHYRGLTTAHLRWMATTMLSGHYIPLTWLSFGIDYTLWGMNPVGYHATNLLLHLANAVLFYLLALSLLRFATGFAEGPRQASALTAAAFFALHPLRAESVAWATERRDVLCGFFFLLALLLYVRASEARTEFRRAWLAGSVAAFLMALLSKSIVMTAPAVLVLLDVYPLRRLSPRPATWLQRVSLPVWREKVPYVVIAAAGVAVAYHALVTATLRDPGAEPPWTARPGLVAYSLVFYVTRTLMPVDLAPLYELPARVDPWDSRFLGSLAAVVLTTIVLWLVRKRWPAGLAVGVSYALLLAPVSGVVSAGYQLAHDRYSYLSCMGLALLVGGGAGTVLTAVTRGALGAWVARLLTASIALWIVVLAGLTWQQVHVWRDNETLWRHAVASEPDCSICLGNLGLALYRTGRPHEALPYLERAVALRPDRQTARRNLAFTLIALGRPAEALPGLQQLQERNPDDPVVLNGLGVALIHLGRYAEAATYLRRAAALKHDDGQIQTHLGIALTRLGHPEQGIAHLRTAVALLPTAGEPRLGLARAHLVLGDVEAAREQHEALKRLDPRLAATIHDWPAGWQDGRTR